MPAPISLQLYTVREALAQDLEGLLQRIAEIGFVGVQPFGLPGATATRAGALARDLGLEVFGSHTGWPLNGDTSEVLEAAAALGLRYIVLASTGRENFTSADGIARLCERINQAAASASQQGFRFAVHNHEYEFEQVDGQPGYKYLIEHLDPQVFFEVDTYWVKVAGLDPAAVLRELGPRAPLLHIKDGPAVKDAPQVALGQGIVDIQGIIAAAGDHAEWLTVELDHCATDMLTAVEQSYHYLVGQRLARGKQA